jgi:hypothetical protein
MIRMGDTGRVWRRRDRGGRVAVLADRGVGDGEVGAGMRMSVGRAKRVWTLPEMRQASVPHRPRRRSESGK